MADQFLYGQTGTIQFPVFVAGSRQFATDGDWTPGGTSAILVSDGVVQGYLGATVSYVGSKTWQLPISATEMQAKRLSILISETGTIDDQMMQVDTIQNDSAHWPVVLGSIGTVTLAVQVNSLIDGTIGKVNSGTVNLAVQTNSVVAGTVGLAVQTNTVIGGTVGLAAQVNSLVDGTIGKVNSDTVNLAVQTNNVVAGTVGLAAQVNSLIDGTIGKVNSGTIGLAVRVNAGTVDLAKTVNSVVGGTVNLAVRVNTLIDGTVGKVNSGTIGLAQKVSSGTLDYLVLGSRIQTGSVDLAVKVNSGTVGLAEEVTNVSGLSLYEVKVRPAYNVNTDEFVAAGWIEKSGVVQNATSATFTLFTGEGASIYSSWDSGPTEVATLNSWFVKKSTATLINGGTAYLLKADFDIGGVNYSRLEGFGAYGTGTGA